MKKTLIALVAVALLAVPASAAAQHRGPLAKNAAKYCKSLRDQMGADLFRQSNGGGKDAFGKCVSKRVHELRAARRAAIRSCKQELQTQSHKNGNRRSFRSCVRQETRATTSDDDEAVLNAAKTCAAERDQDPAAFTDRYGTNVNKRNAFGKCVSQHADDQGDDTTEPGDDTTNPGTEPGEDNSGTRPNDS